MNLQNLQNMIIKIEQTRDLRGPELFDFNG